MKRRIAQTTGLLVSILMLSGLLFPVAPVAANDGTVDILLSPASGTFISGENYTVTVTAQCGDQAVHGIDIYIDFDPAYLAYQASEAGAYLPEELKSPEYNNVDGTFEFSAGKLNSPPSGEFTVISITFQAISAVTNTAIGFSTSGDRETMVVWGEENITGELTGGEYTILERPEVISVEPADESEDVGVDTAVVLTFSKAMNEAATEGAFSIMPAVEGGFNWNIESTEMTFDPDEDLDGSVQYTVTLSTAAEDFEGVPLSEEFVSAFTTEKTLEEIKVTPEDISIPKGGTYQFTVTPTYTDGTHTPMPEIEWSSSDDNKVSIDQNGLATAENVTEAAVTIKAACGEIEGIAAMSVTEAELLSLEIDPGEATRAKGLTQQF
ncbi:MAG: Ig-like domain-containing protein, partial [Dehalococcoidales bacterium]|nr:Ig-like domain-containing protein [Dehalococcoidales bacterium]